MTTSTRTHQPSTEIRPLRLRLGESPAGADADGAWWPHSRELQTEIAQLVDGFPIEAGRINRVLFSRPDWDDAVRPDGHGVRRITAARGWVKVGSFPRDDTRTVVLSLWSGQRLTLQVIPSSTDADEGQRLLVLAGRADDDDPQGASW